MRRIGNFKPHSHKHGKSRFPMDAQSSYIPEPDTQADDMPSNESDAPPESKLPCKLYIVATPIGNLEDITLRALRILREADLILAEDTRRTRVLLDHYAIRKPLQSYHVYNEHERTESVLDRVRAGSAVALVSDAGTPCIADPGFLLVREAAAQNIPVEIIPGVSAITFAIPASALPSDKFAFYGFLPVKSGRRSAAIRKIADEDKTCIVYESPFRLGKLLSEITEILGPDTPVSVIREATKVHEEILRGSAAELVQLTLNRAWKGECVVVIYPKNTLPVEFNAEAGDDRADDRADSDSPS